MTDTPAQPISKRKLLLGGAAGVVAGAAIVVLFVLPAERGYDPTGVGTALGLTKIAKPDNPELERGLKRTGVLTLSDAPPAPLPGASDRFKIELPPFESIELKYEIAEGDAMVFRWHASAPVHYDMHAHPFEGGTALTESYSIDDAAQMQGRYVAPFTGIHGWYWQNRSLDNVTLTLEASGDIVGSRTFDRFGEHPRELTSPAPVAGQAEEDAAGSPGR